MRCSNNNVVGAATQGCLAGLVIGSLTLTPALGYAQVSKSSCAEGADNDTPQQVYVLYWDNSIVSDTSGEVTVDALMLSSAAKSFTPGLIGTKFNETVCQYYDLCTPPAYNVNDVQAATSAWAVGGSIPTHPTCSQEQGLIDSFASSRGYTGNRSYVTVLQYNPRQTALVCGGGCAYHTITPSGHNPYIALPYVTNTNCGGPTIYDTLAADINHEYAEIVTDPVRTGWIASSGNEIGDGVCDDLPTFPLLQAQLFYTGTGPAFHFGLQPLYSNEFSALSKNNSCVYARTALSRNFYLGDDGEVWEQQDTVNGGARWGLPTHPFTSALSAVSWGPGRFDVFAFDTNSHLGHLSQQGAQAPVWTDWGGPPSSDTYTRRPEVCSWGAGRLDVFATALRSGSQETVLHRSWDNGTDSGWTDIGPPSGGVASAPAAVSWGYSEIDVFVLGADGNLYRATSTDGGTFTAWSSRGKPSGQTLTGDPDVGSWLPGRLDVYFVNSAGSLSHFLHDDSLLGGFENWDTWSPPTGYSFTGSPTAVGMGDYRIKVSATTTSGTFVQYLWTLNGVTSGPLGADFAPQFNASSLTTDTSVVVR